MIRGLHGFLLAVVLVVSFSPGKAAGQGLPFEMPEDPANTDVFLVTVSIGDAIWARFGHTIVRIFDYNSGRQYNFNWGIFDFQEDNFAYKFYRGALLYKVGLQRWEPLVEVYRRYEKRSMVQDKINLTTKQKQRLYERIAWNARAENIYYKYHHFYNNCSTKVRDYLDEALHGKIRNGIGPEMSGRTFRDHVRTNMDGLWWADIGIEITTNALFDLPLTKWDEMFLPEYLRRYLAEMPALDDEGNPRPGTKLLSDTTQILDLPPPPPGFPPLATFGILFGGLFVVGTGLYVGQRKRNAVSSGLLRLIGVAFLLFGLWSGLFGLTMFLNWTVSGHTDLYHNANLWLFFPVDWLFVFFGCAWLVTGRYGSLSRTKKLTSGLAWLHIACAIIAAILWVSGVIDQDISRILSVFGPIVVLMSVLWLLMARDASGRSAEAV